ncbi:hypothetical protein NBRC116493_04240 [Aurantivibrio infirmus]
MAYITCTSHLESVGPCEPRYYEGDNLKVLLEKARADFPRLPNYLLDDHGKLRKHVAVFIDGDLQNKETALDKPLIDTSEVYLMQALSGG